MSLVFPGGLGGPNWGGTASDPRSGYVFVATQDVGALGWVRKTQDGAAVAYEKTAPKRATFDVVIGDEGWPCQKPPWGRLIAVNAASGDIAWQMPLGITEKLPAGRQNTGRPVLAGPIVTAGGVLFIGSTDDNRFRALDARNGSPLWVDQARPERKRQSDHVSGTRRQAIRCDRRDRHAQGLYPALDRDTRACHGFRNSAVATPAPTVSIIPRRASIVLNVHLNCFDNSARRSSNFRSSVSNRRSIVSNRPSIVSKRRSIASKRRSHV